LPELLNKFQSAFLKLERDDYAANSIFFFFIVCYSNFYLVFSLKYWTLSLKLDALMRREREISNNKNLIVKLLYFVLELTIFIGATLQLVYVFKYWNSDVQPYPPTLIYLGFALLVTVSLFSLAFVCDGLRRLNALLDHDDLGIYRQ
jgi:hypothetical protein